MWREEFGKGVWPWAPSVYLGREKSTAEVGQESQLPGQVGRAPCVHDGPGPRVGPTGSAHLVIPTREDPEKPE